MTKKTNRWIAVLLALLMLFSSWPTTALMVEAAAKPKLAKSSASITIGGRSQIKVKNARGGVKYLINPITKILPPYPKKVSSAA